MNEDQMQLTRVEQLLQENLEVGRETNEMLRDMRRIGRVWFWLRLLIWAAVIILPLLLLKPILETLVPVTGTGTSGSGFFGIPSVDELKEIRESLEASQAPEIAQ